MAGVINILHVNCLLFAPFWHGSRRAIYDNFLAWSLDNKRVANAGADSGGAYSVAVRFEEELAVFIALRPARAVLIHNLLMVVISIRRLLAHIGCPCVWFAC